MTNVESMDYTHSHPSIIASLFGTVHCPFSPRESVQTSQVHPNPVIWYALSHISLLYLPQNSHHTYLSWHFHSHSEIYCHATSIIIIYMTWAFIVILPLHDHVVDIVFVAKPPCIIFHTCRFWFIAPSRYTAGGIHMESYFVLVSSCNPWVVNK